MVNNDTRKVVTWHHMLPFSYLWVRFTVPPEFLFFWNVHGVKKQSYGFFCFISCGCIAGCNTAYRTGIWGKNSSQATGSELKSKKNKRTKKPQNYGHCDPCSWLPLWPPGSLDQRVRPLLTAAKGCGLMFLCFLITLGLTIFPFAMICSVLGILPCWLYLFILKLNLIWDHCKKKYREIQCTLYPVVPAVTSCIAPVKYHRQEIDIGTTQQACSPGLSLSDTWSYQVDGVSVLRERKVFVLRYFLKHFAFCARHLACVGSNLLSSYRDFTEEGKKKSILFSKWLRGSRRRQSLSGSARP